MNRLSFESLIIPLQVIKCAQQDNLLNTPISQTLGATYTAVDGGTPTSLLHTNFFLAPICPTWNSLEIGIFW